MSLSFDDVMTRFLGTRYDYDLFDKFVEIGLPADEVRQRKSTYRQTRSLGSRRDLLEREARRLRPAYEDLAINDILLREIVVAVKGHPRIRDEVFGHADTERKLYPTVQKYLRKLRNQKQYDEVFATYDRKDLPIGNPDFIAVKKGWRDVKTVAAIDVKATLASLHDFYFQAKNYQRGVDLVFLATTNWLAIQEKGAHLRHVLSDLGAGLVLVDMNKGHCNTALPSKKVSPDKETRQKLLRIIGWK